MVFWLLVFSERRRHLRPLQSGVNVSGSCEFQLVETFDRADARDDFFRDFARSFSQSFSEIKRQWQRIFPEINSWRLLDYDFGQIDVVGAADILAKSLDQTLFEMTVQEFP
jgi:hypothetical protein